MSNINSKTLSNKIDFAVIISVRRANPNGDPLSGNRPRQTYDGYGEISDVCLKRKIRNRLQDMGESIFVQSDDNRVDDFRSLNDRFNAADFSDTRKMVVQSGLMYEHLDRFLLSQRKGKASPKRRSKNKPIPK